MAAPAPPNIPPAPRRGDFVDFCGSIFHVLAVADGVALLRDIKRRRFEVAHLEFCVVVARALSETPDDPQPNPNMEMIAMISAAPKPSEGDLERAAMVMAYGTANDTMGDAMGVWWSTVSKERKAGMVAALRAALDALTSTKET